MWSPRFLASSCAYLYGYTMMELGHWEAAQERFYIDLKKGIQEKGTSMQFFALFSLEQIYNLQNEYTIALEYNNQASRATSRLK